MTIEMNTIKENQLLIEEEVQKLTKKKLQLNCVTIIEL